MKKFHIIARPLQNWYLQDVKDILSVCIIIHNMTVEIRREEFVFCDLRVREDDEDDEDLHDDVPPVSLFNALDGGISDDRATVVAHLSEKVEDAEMHQKLQDDLKYHLFNVYKTSTHED